MEACSLDTLVRIPSCLSGCRYGLNVVAYLRRAGYLALLVEMEASPAEGAAFSLSRRLLSIQRSACPSSTHQLATVP